MRSRAGAEATRPEATIRSPVLDGRQLAWERIGPSDDRTVTGRVPVDDAAQPASRSESAASAPATSRRLPVPALPPAVDRCIAEG
jgi:hypothetical protein